MGSHLVNGKFQSDKYPTCPPGKVPLSVEDKSAQDLLWEYAQRRREVDAEFSDDLESALRAAGYDGYGAREFLRWWLTGKGMMERQCFGDPDLRQRARSPHAAFMQWLAGEELAGNGPWARRHPEASEPEQRFRHAGLMHMHFHLVETHAQGLRGMLCHVGYTDEEADTLVQAFRLMFPHMPEREEGYVPPPTAGDLERALVEAGFEPTLPKVRYTVADAQQHITDAFKRGGRVNAVAKAGAVLAWTGTPPPSGAYAADLLRPAIEASGECDPEGVDYWLRMAADSYEKSLSRRQHGATQQSSGPRRWGDARLRVGPRW